MDNKLCICTRSLSPLSTFRWLCTFDSTTRTEISYLNGQGLELSIVSHTVDYMSTQVVSIPPVETIDISHVQLLLF